MCFTFDGKAFLDQELRDWLSPLELLPHHSPLLRQAHVAYAFAQHCTLLLLFVGILKASLFVCHLNAFALDISELLEAALFFESSLNLLLSLNASLLIGFGFQKQILKN